MDSPTDSNPNTTAKSSAAAFSKADRNLLVRIGRLLRARADAIEQEYGHGWSAYSKEKSFHDRLRREERDLAALRKRIDGDQR